MKPWPFVDYRRSNVARACDQDQAEHNPKGSHCERDVHCIVEVARDRQRSRS